MERSKSQLDVNLVDSKPRCSTVCTLQILCSQVKLLGLCNEKKSSDFKLQLMKQRVHFTISHYAKDDKNLRVNTPISYTLRNTHRFRSKLDSHNPEGLEATFCVRNRYPFHPWFPDKLPLTTTLVRSVIEPTRDSLSCHCVHTDMPSKQTLSKDGENVRNIPFRKRKLLQPPN